MHYAISADHTQHDSTCIAAVTAGTLQVPKEDGFDRSPELAVDLELLDTGYDDQKIKVKMKDSGSVKQVC